MAHNAQRPNNVAIRKRDEMSCKLVVLVDFKLCRDHLFNDEHFVLQRKYRWHERVCGSDLNNCSQFPSPLVRPPEACAVGISL